jgi:cytochrome c556
MRFNPKTSIVRRPLASVSVSLLLAASCATAPQPEPPQAKQFQNAVSAPRRLEPPEDLSNTARAILRSRMASHARDMGDLMSAVMILDYPTIRERASRISADASLARPLSADATELNAALPERFFDLQDELKVRATALGAASARNDAFQVADAYGKLSETCVSCHASYRKGRPR